MTNSLSDSNVLLTGGQGFVGSWLRDSLVSNGARLTLLVRDIHPKLDSLYQTPPEQVDDIVHGRLEDRSLVERIFLEKEIRFCFHLAAQSIVNKAQVSPRSTVLTNVVGTLNLLEAARKSETLQGIVIASTDKVYGEPTDLPITEEHRLDPRYIYESSKACSDILSRSYYQSYGLPIAVARSTNTYGGRDLSRSRIIPSVVLSLLSKKQPIVETDGTPVRDYLYISDAVSAYLALAHNVSKPSVKGQPFNFGTGKPTTVRDVVSRIAEYFPKEQHPIYLNKPGGIQKQYVSFQKANDILGWKPRISLEQGLRETVGWYKQHSSELAYS